MQLPHRIDVDEVMENIAEVLRKIAQYSLENKVEFEKLVKDSLYKEQTEEVKKNQKRMPQITDRMEQIERVMNKLYEDNALGNMDTERYEQLSRKYAEEYYTLKAEKKKSKNAYPNVKMQTKEQRDLSDLQKAIPTLKNLLLPSSMSLLVKS